ncbi:unnamed protein product [Clonostachys rosea]|uniref:Ubiquitin-related modifier 1 n=1 Tax=Bionectria ochroleuca TaxID=29856 RepID=A0ABY6UZW3_BIOOC|nr:unnamed protein product [Clonostachys rosea]
MGPPSNATDPQPVIPLKIEFSGGLEILFADERHHSLSLPALDKDGSPSNIGFLINYLCENLMKDQRKELFVLDDHLHNPVGQCRRQFLLPHNLGIWCFQHLIRKPWR